MDSKDPRVAKTEAARKTGAAPSPAVHETAVGRTPASQPEAEVTVGRAPDGGASAPTPREYVVGHAAGEARASLDNAPRTLFSIPESTAFDPRAQANARAHARASRIPRGAAAGFSAGASPRPTAAGSGTAADAYRTVPPRTGFASPARTWEQRAALSSAQSAPSASGTPPTGAAPAEKQEKKSEGIMGGLSIAQVTAGALAAVTSMLLSSQIGIAGSVIGVAIGSVVSTVASQLYKQFLSRTGAAIKERVNGGSSNDDEAYEGADAASATGAAGATTVLGEPVPGADGAEAAPSASLAGASRSEALAAARKRRSTKHTQIGVIVVAIVSALVAVGISAFVINTVTAGEGVGTKTEPIVLSQSNDSDSGSAGHSLFGTRASKSSSESASDSKNATEDDASKQNATDNAQSSSAQSAGATQSGSSQQGSTTENGSTGSTGSDASSTGSTGSTGSGTSAGSAGSTGSNGSTGSTGSGTSTGSAGSTGSNGSTGSTGSAGSTGSNGSTALSIGSANSQTTSGVTQ